MELSAGRKQKDISGFQLSLFLSLVLAAMGILFGATLGVMERIRRNPKERQAWWRAATWLRERSAVALWRSEP
jgi:hypothetical protein